MTATKLNPVQLHLLQLFAHNLGQQDLEEVKSVLADYFIQKADKEMQRLQLSRSTTQADLDALLNAHLRTPYNAV